MTARFLAAAFIGLTVISVPVRSFTTIVLDQQRRRWRGSPITRIRSADEAALPTPSLDKQRHTAAIGVPSTVSREKGLLLLNTVLMPQQEYGNRIALGRDAQGLEPTVAVSADDPRHALTYGEFPLTSLDELLDVALPHLSHKSQKRITMIDLGSGCGRLAFYMALTRGTTDLPWTIHGIEISQVLHNVAIQTMAVGVAEGMLVETIEERHISSLIMHVGPAADWKEVLREASLVFAYSTVFPSRGFSEELGAMVLGSEWSSLLAESCPNGCVAITTDRALDPKDGWVLVDRLDVENREVMGSTGYIQILKRPS